MKFLKQIVFFTIFLFFVFGLQAQPAKQFYKMSKQEIDRTIRELSNKPWTPAQKINYIS